MGEPIVDKNTPGEWEDLRLVLKTTEGSRVNKPVAVALKLRPVVVAFGVLVLLPEPHVRYQFLPVHFLASLFLCLGPMVAAGDKNNGKLAKLALFD